MTAHERAEEIVEALSANIKPDSRAVAAATIEGAIEAALRELEVSLRHRLHSGEVLVDAAREHILALGKCGLGHLAVAEAAGLSHNTVLKIRNGSKWKCRQSTEARILAVDEGAIKDGALVPAGPTWKILDSLIQRGFTRGQLALWLGFKAPALHLRKDTVTAANASRVERVARLLEAGKLRRGGPGLPPVRSKRYPLIGSRGSAGRAAHA